MPDHPKAEPFSESEKVNLEKTEFFFEHELQSLEQNFCRLKIMSVGRSESR